LGRYDFPLDPNCRLSFPFLNVLIERDVSRSDPYNIDASIKLETPII